MDNQTQTVPGQAIPNPTTVLPPISQLFKDSWHTFIQSILPLFILNIIGIVIYVCLVLVAIIILIIFGAWSSLLQNGLLGFTLLFTNPTFLVVLFGTTAAFGILFFITSTVLQISSILVVDSQGKKPIGETLYKSTGLIIPLVLINTLTFILIFGSFFVLILPMILFLWLLAFVPYEVILGGYRWTAAIRRSVLIVSRHFGAIVVRLIILGLIYLALVVVIPALLDKIGPQVQIFVGIISFIINLLLGWYMLAYSVTLYKQARVGLEQEPGKGILWMWVVAIIGWLIVGGLIFAGAQIISSGLLKNFPSPTPGFKIPYEQPNFRTL